MICSFLSKRLLFAVAFFSVISCGRKDALGDNAEAVPVPKDAESDFFSDKVSLVELIPLETTDECLFGPDANLMVGEGCFYIIDTGVKRIFRFSPTGHFLGKVGFHGHSASEYNSINSVQIKQDTLFVYSYPDKVTSYDREGEFLSSFNIGNLHESVYFLDDSTLLSYSGYMDGKGKDRLHCIDRSGRELQSYLRTEFWMLNMIPLRPMFFSNGEAVFIVDGLNDTVFRYEDGSLSPDIIFDFGKFRIPDSVFGCRDNISAANELLNHPYALVEQYMENDMFKVVEIRRCDKSYIDCMYGLCKDGEWSWSVFKLDDKHPECTSPFFGSLRDLKGDDIYCLMPAEQIGNLPASLKEKIVNMEVLPINPDSNPIIAKLTI